MESYSTELESQSAQAVEVNVTSLLEAGAHFGHQTERWNPKMLPYIYGIRNNTHIINLDLTHKQFERSRKFICDVSARGGTVLFVGTKTQAREIVKEQALRCGAFYVTTRWLGGTLTNFQTLKNSIDRMKKLEDFLAASELEGSKIKLNKKEKLSISRELTKLESNLGGIRNMKRPPDVIFVIDIMKEEIAVQEGNRLHIPVVALVDTNTDPDVVDFPIPSNDDSTKTIRLFATAVANAVAEGRAALEARMMSDSDKGNEGGSRKGLNGKNGSNGAVVESQEPVMLT